MRWIPVWRSSHWEAPEFLGEPSHASPLRSQQPGLFNFGSTQPAPSWPSNVPSDSTGLVHPGLDTFRQHLALEFCDCAKDLKSQPTRWQCRVDVLFQRNEVHSQRFALLSKRMKGAGKVQRN